MTSLDMGASLAKRALQYLANGQCTHRPESLPTSRLIETIPSLCVIEMTGRGTH
jgi:hypothetical protein